jgi:uncharacterized delta-60 repeat protein
VRAGRSAGASASALQPDGAVVVAGGTIDPLLGSLDVLLARFTPAGSLDTTFGVGGLARWDGGAVAASNPAFRNDGASSVAVQADGRILVAGSSWQFFGASATGGPGNDLLILRYLSDGTLDPAFASGGVLLHDSGYSNSGAGLTLQADQKILALDYSCPGATCDTTLFRYDTGGSPDPAFGPGGRVGFTGCYPVGLAVQPADQKVVVGCRATGVLNVHYELRRFNTDGSVDTGFGTAGVAGLLARGTGDYLAAIAVAPDGKLLAAGDSGQASGVGSTPMVARFTSAGVLDPAFGAAGAFYAASPGPGGEAMAVRPDGRIVLGGTGLLQLTAGGSPDASFGVAGVVVLIGPGSGGLVEAIALQPDGKVVFAGKTADWSYQQSDLLLGRQR